MQQDNIKNYKVRVKMLSSNGQSSAPLCKKIDNYVFRFTEVLGQGNFSKVYRGTHQPTKQIVAIKVIELNSLKSSKLEELLFSEIDVLKKLSHPNILKCHQVFSSNRNCYIITEICNGGDLESKLRRSHHFTQAEAQPYILDVFKGLKYLADNNVIHRDLKVANIFLHNGMAKIADFGFAKFTRETFKDINIGSPIYMSPEGLLNNVYGPKTDVWAFGIFIYQLLHGKTPFSRCVSESDLKRQIQIPIQYTSMKSEISFDLREVILKCLEINEDKRVSIADLEQTPFFNKLVKKDMIALGGSGRRNHVQSSEKKSLKPLEHYSQQKNRYQIRSFHGDGTNGEPRTMSPFSTSNKVNTMANFQSPQNDGRKSYKSPYTGEPNNRPFSAEKKNMFINIRDKTQNNSVQRSALIGSPISYTHQNPQQTSEYTTNSITNTNQKNSNANSAANNLVSKSNTTHSEFSLKPMKNSAIIAVLPGIINFKQCVNTLHYCRLMYKYLMMANELDSEAKTRKFSRILTVWMFKVLKEITQKIDKKEIVYEETSKKENKLKQVTNQYYRKYSAAIQRPFQLDNAVTFDSILAEATIKLEQYQAMQLYKSEMSTHLQLAFFLLMTVESTRLLKNCSQQLRFWQWGEYKDVQEFLVQNKSQLTYQKYLETRHRVLK